MNSSIVGRPVFRPIRDAPLEEQHAAKDMESAARSVTGGRKHNEDRYYRNDQECFYMVADGMGGYQGGALASQIVVEMVPDAFKQILENQDFDGPNVEPAFREAVCGASLEMSRVAANHSDYDRMGCTLAAAFVIGNRLYYGNVGDCRIYLYHKGELKLLTRDQTLVQELVDAGVISASVAATHRLRHLVTNSVSARGMQEIPRLRSIAFDPSGDLVLLTSDGLTNELSIREIEESIRNGSGPVECVDALVRLALDRGARDNVSCVVFR